MVPQAAGTEPVRVTVTIGVKDSIMYAPLRLLTQTFHLPASEASTVEDQVAALVLDGPIAAERRPHSISAQSGRTSWGGDSGWVLSVVLFVSSAVTVGLLERLAHDLYDKLRGLESSSGFHEYGGWRGRLTRDNAVAQARWAIVSRYASDANCLDRMPSSEDDLELVSERHDIANETWTIGLRDRDGSTYRVTLGRIGDVPSPTLIEREAPRQPDHHHR